MAKMTLFNRPLILLLILTIETFNLFILCAVAGKPDVELVDFEVPLEEELSAAISKESSNSKYHNSDRNEYTKRYKPYTVVLSTACPVSRYPFSTDNLGKKCWSPRNRTLKSTSDRATKVNKDFYNIAILKGKEFICGGSIISPAWVLTAAHCLMDSNGNPKKDIFVTYERMMNVAFTDLVIMETALVSRIFIHEEFTPSDKISENDLALLELCQPFDLDGKEKTSVCFSGKQNHFSNAIGSIWKVTEGGTPYSVQDVKLDVLRKERCEEVLNGNWIQTPRNSDSFFCTFQPIQDTSMVNDGGPVIAEVSPGTFKQVGSVSHTFISSENYVLSLHTNISSFANWIVEAMQTPPPIFVSEVNFNCSNRKESFPVFPPKIPKFSANLTPLRDNQCPMSRLFGDYCWSGGPKLTKIMGGSDAPSGRYPFQVGISLANNFICGGSLIAPNWIVTAGHCVVNGDGSLRSEVSVLYGSEDKTKAKSAHVKKIIVHPKYTAAEKPNYYIENDIALLELCQPLKFSLAKIQPICFSSQITQYEGAAIATGWGEYHFFSGTYDLLQEVSLDIINTTTCRKHGPLPPKDPRTYVCAKGDSKATCRGDSGGPLVAEVSPGCWALVGICSSGPLCIPGMTIVGRYTRVSAFKDWICEKTKMC